MRSGNRTDTGTPVYNILFPETGTAGNTLSGQGTSGSNLRHAYRLLSQGCLLHFRKSRNPGADINYCSYSSASPETEHAPLHSRRHRMLHASGTDPFLLIA